MAAVSTRRIKFPRPTGTNPTSRATWISAGANPPSGPTSKAVGVGGVTLAEIVARRGLPSDSQVESLTLDELIAGQPFPGE